MQKFCFRLNKSEEQFRNNIDTAMMYDKPKTVMFFTQYGKGLSFTENGNYIRGVFLNSSDKDDGFSSYRQGSSIRVRFHGKIIRNDEGDFFSGWIYPDPFSFLLIAFIFVFFIFNGESAAAIIFPAFATTLFIAGFVSLTQKCFKELSFIASGE